MVLALTFQAAYHSPNDDGGDGSQGTVVEVRHGIEVVQNAQPAKKRISSDVIFNEGIQIMTGDFF